jgi:hypothetical protein
MSLQPLAPSVLPSSRLWTSTSQPLLPLLDVIKHFFEGN